MNNKYLPSYLTKAEQTAQKMKSQFSELTYEQLNWKPSPNNWSIGQCIDHLIVTNSQYFGIFERLEKGEYNKSIWERLPLWPTLIGKMILKSVLPETQRKQKTFPVFEPAQSEIPADVVSRFLSNHEKLLNYIKASDRLDHQKVVIASPVSHRFTYKLFHVCRIVIEHEERHFLQALRVMEHEQFPQAK